MASMLFLVCTCEAWGMDTYNGSQLIIPAVTVGSATFTNMVVTVASIVTPPNGSSPNGTVDSYNPANNRLTIPSVAVGANVYYNVVIDVNDLVSVGGVSGADVFTGTDLIIPSVQVNGGAIVNNVVVTVASIQSPGGHMPHNVRDGYNTATKELTIAAVVAGGRVFTNAIITPGNIIGINNPTTTASGTITGAWVQDVTVAVSGAASGSTTTDANGHYSFANLPSGQSVTFTPSLTGYNYSPSGQTVAIPAGSSAPVTVAAMSATPAFPSYSISGTVNYTGAATGPVYVQVFSSFNSCNNGCAPNAGSLVKLASGSGQYTVRGLQSGSYTVSAFMDTQGTGQQNDSADPSGSVAGTITIHSGNVTTGADMTLAIPTVSTPAVPQIEVVQPGNSSAFVLYNPSTDNNGNETATSYKLSWGTDTNASNGGTKMFVAQGVNATIAYVPNLTDGAVLYFKMLASDSAGSSTYTTASQPVTIGEPTGNNTVSGMVTFPGTAKGPMVVVLHPPHGNGGIFFTVVGSQASPPASGAHYAISGVPTGNYQIAVVIDNDNNGAVSAGDFTYGLNGGAPVMSVSGPTADNIALTTANATTALGTSYFSAGGGSSFYGISPTALNGTKQVENITLFSGPNVAVPLDMGNSVNGGGNVNLANSLTAPISGQSYGLLVTYGDGSTQILTANVGVVMGPDNLPQNLVVSASSGVDTPTFSWSAPAILPALTPFVYSLQGVTSNSIDVPSSVTSVDLATLGKSLSSGSYVWQIAVEDADGNSAQAQATNPYVAP